MSVLSPLAVLVRPAILAQLAACVLSLTAALMLLCRDARAHFSGLLPEDDDTLAKKAFNRLYFSATSISALGYGDIAPKSATARLLAMLAAFFTIALTLSQLQLLETGPGSLA